jgi:hypothetical protein
MVLGLQMAMEMPYGGVERLVGRFHYGENLPGGLERTNFLRRRNL